MTVHRITPSIPMQAVQFNSYSLKCTRPHPIGLHAFWWLQHGVNRAPN